jgi:hypothetical protein
MFFGAPTLRWQMRVLVTHLGVWLVRKMRRRRPLLPIMSGLVGHSVFALLAAREAERRQFPLAALLRQQEASYLAGAYIGSDIQVMPQAVCLDTRREVGFGTVPMERSPLTGGPVRQWTLRHEEKEYTPKQIHEWFYGRAHLVFGWSRNDAYLAVPWDHLGDYCALVVRDQWREAPGAQQPLAYLFGWMVHIVSDSLIKSIQPGVRLRLLDGTYTRRNRPIQDLFAFYEVGVKELKVNWPAAFEKMAKVPVEPVQSHYMRVSEPRGELARLFTEGWRPEQAALLNAVLNENRRWLAHHAQDVLAEMAVDDTGMISATARETIGEALTYPQLMEMAEKARVRDTLDLISTEAAKLFEQVLAKTPELKSL